MRRRRARARRSRGAPSHPAHPPTRPRPLQAARRGARQWWPDAWNEPAGGAGPPEALITIFCADGAVARFPPRLAVAAGGGAARPPPRRRALTARGAASADEDSDLDAASLDLCVGSVFAIRATNGLDPTRRLAVLGFCASVDALLDGLEAGVAEGGGEVRAVRREPRPGLAERLSVRLALPLLFGVPPEHERLRAAIARGGGIVDRVVAEWLHVGGA